MINMVLTIGGFAVYVSYQMNLPTYSLGRSGDWAANNV